MFHVFLFSSVQPDFLMFPYYIQLEACKLSTRTNAVRIKENQRHRMKLQLFRHGVAPLNIHPRHHILVAPGLVNYSRFYLSVFFMLR